MLAINTIHCGDNLELLSKTPNNSIDMIVTSPPYFHQREYCGLGDGKEATLELYIERQLLVFKQYKRILKTTGNIFLNYGDKYIASGLNLIPHRIAILILDAYPCIKLRNEITWVKNTVLPNSSDRRLPCVKEPFFHFVKTNDYYYNRDDFLKTPKKVTSLSSSIMQSIYRWKEKIRTSSIADEYKEEAYKEIDALELPLKEGRIQGVRVRVRGGPAMAVRRKGGDEDGFGEKGYHIIRTRDEYNKPDIIVWHPCQEHLTHPARFPVSIIREFIMLGCPQGGVVLDPYMGSGTTAVAAKMCKRKWIGIDIAQDYCEEARKRIRNTCEPLL